MIPKNGDRWWTLLLIIMVVSLSINIATEIGQRRESAFQRREIMDYQLIILANQTNIMRALTRVKLPQ
jgi:hypothetical protein